MNSATITYVETRHALSADYIMNYGF